MNLAPFSFPETTCYQILFPGISPIIVPPETQQQPPPNIPKNELDVFLGEMDKTDKPRVPTVTYNRLHHRESVSYEEQSL